MTDTVTDISLELKFPQASYIVKVLIIQLFTKFLALVHRIVSEN